MDKTKHQLVGWISAASVLLFCLWLFFIRSLLQPFQNAHGSDPLAMINVLFPGFWLLLAGYALLSFLTVHFRLDVEYLHLLLLCGLSFLLFFTPFLLSGFSWSPDSLFHGGIASYMPQIVGGEAPPLSGYAASYPLSFIDTFLVEVVTGLDIFRYSLYVYPVISIATFTLLVYTFISRLLDSAKAFLSMLIALPALHFLEPHVSPFSVGTLLIVSALIALTSESTRMRFLSYFLLFAVVLTHPVSPLSLGIFLGSALIISFFERRFSRRRQLISSPLVSTISWELFFLLGIFWLIWTLNWAATIYASVNYALSKIVTLEFLQDLQLIAEFTGSGGFIYGEIQLLSLILYGVFGIIDLTILYFSLPKLRADTMDSRSVLQLFMAFSSLIFAAYAYLLFLGTGEHVLLGRGLLFFILNSSIAFTIHFHQNPSKTWKKVTAVLTFTLILVLFMTFPVNSYSKEAYNTHTPTSGAGLTFIGSYLDLSTKSISMAADRQLASYVDLNEGLILSKYPPNVTDIAPDFIALRINYYFLISMRYDLSFFNNTYTQLHAAIEANTTYHKLYSNALFEIYGNNRAE